MCRCAGVCKLPELDGVPCTMVLHTAILAWKVDVMGQSAHELHQFVRFMIWWRSRALVREQTQQVEEEQVFTFLVSLHRLLAAHLSHIF